MIDKDILQKNKDYTFNEDIHTYYWKDNKVDTSVTSFIQRYFKEFDTENISRAYAEKHGLLQEDVKRQWKEAGDISAMGGTIIHAYLEATKNNAVIDEDYTKAIKAGLEEQVRERVKVLMPKAINFANDTKDLLTPIATEYTVGLEDKLAGNIDLLAWNNEDQEIQIWDYKNLKQMSKTNNYQKCFAPFDNLDDCNFSHYSLQLSFYKAMAQRLLGIKIGKLKLVHFNYTTKKDNYTIYDAIDLSELCDKELDKLLIPKQEPKITASVKVGVRNGIYGGVPF